MDLCAVWLPLLHLWMLLPLPSQTGVVRRIGCLVQTGNEKQVNVERMRGRESDKAREMAQQRGPFRALVGDYSQMTVQVCVERCWMRRYTFAAMQDGTRCFCANSRGGMVQVDTAMCSERCSGNCKQLCGGRIALSVYHTGFEQEPVIFDADVSRGLIGCYKEQSWLNWCGPSDEDDAFEKQRLNYPPELQPRNDVPDDVIMAAFKPPLVSVRMSALLCASYCVSGPRGNPVAVLRSNDTCCCGRSLEKSGIGEKDKVEFSSFCNAPCADDSTRPYCVGNWNGQRYISVYNTFDIWPVVGMRPQSPDGDPAWLQPVYPPNERFEVTAFKPKWSPPEQDELAGVDLFLPDQPPPPPSLTPSTSGSGSRLWMSPKMTIEAGDGCI